MEQTPESFARAASDRMRLTCHGSFIQPRPESKGCLRRLAQVEQSPDVRSFHLAQRGGRLRWSESARSRPGFRNPKLVLPSAATDEPVFAPLVVCDPAPAPFSCDRSSADEEQIRIVIGEVRLELAADTPAVRLAEIVRALGAVPC